MNAHTSIDTDLLKRWRLIKDGGDDFVEEFLVRRVAERADDFSFRRNVTYDPGTASAAVDDVVNSMAARLDVSRSGGSLEYQDIISGANGGVDKKGASMNNFLIKEVIPELCYMGKVCWVVHNFVDTADERKVPYIVQHPAEEIFNWTYKDNKLVAFAVKYKASVIDENTGFASDEVDVIRAFRLTESGVETWIQTEGDVVLDPITLEPSSGAKVVLPLDEIPVVVFELPVALLSKIDKMQIAALNIESADIDWLRTANITLYTEQGTSNFPNSALIRSEDNTEEEDRFEVTLGSKNGRRYPLNAERPGFISPSAEPIRASMEKQVQIANRIKDVLKSNMATMSLASAESIQLLGQGMESGLFMIGTVLNLGEVAFARIFHKYLNRESTPVTVSYPKKYELKTEDDRITKTEKIKSIAKTIGSNVAKKHLEIEAIHTLLEGKVSYEVLQEIEDEILATDFCIYDPETVQSLVESGIISHQLASTSVGAPSNDYASAEQEHIRRIIAVKVSQTSGMGEVDPDPKFSEKIKKEDATNEVRDSGGV